jgi:hypothetical protein
MLYTIAIKLLICYPSDAGIPEQQKAGRQAKTSQLLSCLKDALKETEEVWDLAIGNPTTTLILHQTNLTR